MRHQLEKTSDPVSNDMDIIGAIVLTQVGAIDTKPRCIGANEEESE